MAGVLSPCPFCGGDARYGDLYEGAGQRPSKGYMCIRCDACELFVTFGERGAWNMVARWNRRAEAKDDKPASEAS